MHASKMCIVVPCYNEEDVLSIASERLLKVLRSLVEKEKVNKGSFILFVDDGSIDKTWRIIKDLYSCNNEIKGLKLARNYGHQKALLAGLLKIKNMSDCAISIDADLQDDINIIEEMVNKYYDGYDIVYGVRKNRNVDSIFKRGTAHLFYKLLKFLKVETIYNHADFRLVNRRVIEELSKFKETNPYLRGIFPLIGLRSTDVYYKRKQRAAGITKYPLRRMISFAWGSITSFSIFPMRLILIFGMIVLFISFVLFLWAFSVFLTGKSIPGWASTVIPIYVLGGLQMASMGLLGEYIGKIYEEVKSRPRFIIEEEIF